MFIPIGDENIDKQKPYLTRLLVLINIGIFIYQIMLPSQEEISNFVLRYGAVPIKITNGVDVSNLFTCMFLHGGIMHLVGNMLMLWIFGDNIEATVGHYKFLLFYLLTGLAASLAHIFFNLQSTMPMIGASGAISGCLGAYLILFPKNKVKIFFFFIVFRIAAFIVIGLWIGGQILSTMQTFSLKTTHTQSESIAYMAHIGGFVAGIIWALRQKRNAPKPKYNLD